MKIRYSQYQTFIFSLFIISGGIKFLFIYYKIPVDITLLFAILITLDIIYNLAVNQSQIRFTPSKLFFLCLFLAFYLLFFLSLFYTPSQSYAHKKTTYFLLTLLAFVYPVFIRKFDIRFFALIIFCITMPASIWFIIAKHLYWSGYKDQVGIHFYPLLGSYAGLSVNVAFLIFYFTRNRQLTPLIFLIPLLVALGSRGTLIFTLIIILIFEYKAIIRVLLRARIKKRVSILNMVVLLTTIPVIVFFRNRIMEGFKFGLGRFQSFLSPDSDNSTIERIEYLEFSVKSIFHSTNSIIFGYGIGSFGFLFNGIESRDIPHNIYLEAWFELGLLGFILILSITLFPIFLRNRDPIIKMTALFFLLDSMKSGGFESMRLMFGIYGALIFMSFEKKPVAQENLPNVYEPDPTPRIG